MSWFRVDDTLWRHRKLRRLYSLAGDDRAANAAMGMWNWFGSWCSDGDEGGFVPAWEVERYRDPNPAELAVLLVGAGFWEPAKQDGEDGYEYHDWEQYRPPVKVRNEAQQQYISEVRREAGRRGGTVSAQVRAEKARAKQNEANQILLASKPQPNEASQKFLPRSKTTGSERERSKNEANLLEAKPSNEALPVPVPDPVPGSGVAVSSQSSVAVATAPLLEDWELDEISDLTRGPATHAAKTAAFILGKAPDDIRTPLRYVLAAIRTDPDAYRYRRSHPTPDQMCAEHPGEYADACRSCAMERRLGDDDEENP